METMPSIWTSRKFWIMVTDLSVSLITYFTGKYLDANSAKDILFLIGSLQPIVLLVVGSITLQNVAGIKANGSVQEAGIKAQSETTQAAVYSGNQPVG